MKLQNAAVAALFAVGQSAYALGPSVDYSDLWYNPAESGWGVNVIQQGDIAFATLFVYGPGSQPTWYVASSARWDIPFVGTFSGPLYATTGTPAISPWNPSQSATQQVGSFTFAPHNTTSATIQYSVNGTTITKEVRRQTWRAASLSGGYVGAAAGTYSAGCPGPGYLEEPAIISVSDIDLAQGFTMTASLSSSSCTYRSTARDQYGRLQSASGTFSCTNGFAGSFTVSDLEVSPLAFSARAQLQAGACTWSGVIGGLRRNGG